MAATTVFAILARIAASAVALFMFNESQAREGDLTREVEALRAEGDGRRSISAPDAMLTAIVDYVPVGVVLLGEEEQVLVCNRHATAILRLENRHDDRHLSELSSDPEVLALVRQALHQRHTASGVMVSAPGQFIEVKAHPLEGGRALVILQDVSELRLLRSVRRDFVANVSHELRTPLASIRLLVDTLEAGAMEEAEVSAGFVHRIGVETDHLIQMVTELLELSRIESGQLPIRREPLQLGELIRGAVERLSVVALDKGIVVNASIADNLPAALADRDGVTQILMNLLFNAIKFTPRDGTVQIRAIAQDGHLTVSMADTGVGIAPEDIARIFERFYKSDKSRARSGGGTGLGLPIARHIVESHGGSIWAESEEGHGSTFTFTLPTA